MRLWHVVYMEEWWDYETIKAFMSDKNCHAYNSFNKMLLELKNTNGNTYT